MGEANYDEEWWDEGMGGGKNNNNLYYVDHARENKLRNAFLLLNIIQNIKLIWWP